MVATASKSPLSNTTFTPSIYQSDFFAEVLEGTGDILLEAVAGSGKSTSLAQAVYRLPLEIRNSVLVVAFNKHIKEDIEGKLPAGVTVSTLHSLGQRIIRRALRPTNREWVYDNKYRNLVRIHWLSLNLAPYQYELQITKDAQTAMESLVNYAQLTLVDPYNEEAVMKMVRHFNLDLPDEETMLAALPKILEWGKTGLIDQYGKPFRDKEGRTYHPSESISFNDMVWLPNVLEGIQFDQYKMVFCDECFPADARVTMADGTTKLIGDIVENGIQGEVLSYSEQKQGIVKRRITGWHKVPLRGRDIVTINNMRCTEDHPVYIKGRGYIEARKALSSGGEVLTLNEEIQLCGLFDSNGEIPIDRVASWRRINQSRCMEGCSRQCPCEISTRAQAMGILGMEVPNLEEMGGQSHIGASAYRVRGKHQAVHYLDPSGIYGNISHYLPVRSGEANNATGFRINGRPCACGVVHGRRLYGQVGGKDSNVFFSGTRPDTCGTVFNPEGNVLSSSEYCKRTNIATNSTGGAKFSGEGAALSASGSCVQGDSEIEWVYCIDVEDTHSFFADGILVHNCQDLNACQREIVLKSCREGRIAWIGDPSQSIYAFSGADAYSWQQIKESRNPKQMPLSICYRCAKSVVARAKTMVPHIEASETAPEGIVDKVQESKFGEIIQLRYDRRETPMILCRVNAPLISFAFELISRGIPAKVKGRDIGASLIKIVDIVAKNKSFDFEKFVEIAEQYKEQQVRVLSQKADTEMQIESLKDRVASVIEVYKWSITKGAKNVGDLRAQINGLFDDNTKCMILSSVHKAKGLEADTVYILKPSKMPHPMARQEWEVVQENNLAYVAVTRAKKELYFVEEDV